MLNIQTIKSLTELRNDPSGVVDLAKKLSEPIYIFNRSKPVSVLMDVNDYEEILDRLEDAIDALEMREFEKLPKRKRDWITHKELKKKYKLT